MAELESRFVRRGTWTDFSKGAIMGQTITTDVQTGTVIVALLAILSTWGAAHLWHLVTFSIHQVRASGQAKDALFRQQQTLLRSLPTPGTVVADVSKLWWTWRRNPGAHSVFMRSITLLVLAAAFTAVSLAASIFSSFVVDTTNLDVLVDSPFCGGLNFETTPATYSWNMEPVAREYSQQCYNRQSLPAACDVYVRPNIPFTISRDVACPFHPGMCINGKAVSIDSGLLDAQSFGLNLATKDGVKYRKKSTCAILPWDGFSSVEKASEFTEKPKYPDEEVISLYYGPQLDQDDNEIDNRTVSWSLLKSNISTDFELSFHQYYSSPNAAAFSTFHPIPDITPQNSDVFLKILMPNHVEYLTPVTDPLFSAHQNASSGTVQFNETVYVSDWPIKAIGCSYQYQFCHTEGSKDTCSEPHGLPRDVSALNLSGVNDLQRTIIQTLITSSYLFDLTLPNAVNASSIKSGTGFIDSLPDDQWIQEIIGWESEVWAAIQAGVTDYAIGPSIRDPLMTDKNVIKPTTSGQKSACMIQKMHKTGGFVNINVFGLAFIVAFSSLVVILDITLLRFLIFMSRFRKALAPRIERWIEDGVWQLQRQAYEHDGYGPWFDLHKEIPQTQDKLLLPDLRLKHLNNETQSTFASTSRSGDAAAGFKNVLEPSKHLGSGFSYTYGRDRDVMQDQKQGSIDISPVENHDWVSKGNAPRERAAWLENVGYPANDGPERQLSRQTTLARTCSFNDK